MKVINPATTVLEREYPLHTWDEVEHLLDRARETFHTWRFASWEERSAVLRRVAGLMRKQQHELGLLITEEMGKAIKEAESEVEKCAWVCDFYATEGQDFLSDEPIESGATASWVRYEPLGAVLAIMPWNFPFWQVFRFAAPAIMAGNVAVLKHAKNVPGCALAIENLFVESGAPAGLFTSLLVNSEAANKVIAHEAIRAVTLTGSERAGVAVAASAGKQIKKCVLELGGSDPFVVLDDVDPRRVAEQAVQARCMNSGQSCIAAKRFIVEQSIMDRFTQAMVAAMEKLVVGDPRQPSTDMGPLAREDLRDTLHDQVERSVAAGARCLTGGQPADGNGYFYPPTVLTHVTPGMAVFDEETFGPVAAVVTADNTDHALRLANQTVYGLGASVWSQDIERAKELALQMDAGNVFINEIVKSDPRLPFGGIKRSGYGRELSRHGIREFVNAKTIRVA